MKCNEQIKPQLVLQTIGEWTNLIGLTCQLNKSCEEEENTLVEIWSVKDYH